MGPGSVLGLFRSPPRFPFTTSRRWSLTWPTNPARRIGSHSSASLASEQIITVLQGLSFKVEDVTGTMGILDRTAAACRHFSTRCCGTGSSSCRRVSKASPRDLVRFYMVQHAIRPARLDHFRRAFLCISNICTSFWRTARPHPALFNMKRHTNRTAASILSYRSRDTSSRRLRPGRLAGQDSRSEERPTHGTGTSTKRKSWWWI